MTGGSAFGANPPANAVLHVPVQYTDNYYNKAGWAAFRGKSSEKNFAVFMTDGDAYTHQGTYTGESYETVQVEYSRTFSNTTYQALFLPFDVSFDTWHDAGLHVYRMTGMVENEADKGVQLNIEEVTEGALTANTPYLVKADAVGTVEFVAPGAVLHDNHTSLNPVTLSLTKRSGKTLDYTFQGVFDYFTNPSIIWYAMSQGEVYRASATARLFPNRWYMTVNGGEEGAGSVKMNLLDTTETGLTSVSSCNPIAAEGPLYDLQGRPVSHPRRGLYVKNGKKYIIK